MNLHTEIGHYILKVYARVPHETHKRAADECENYTFQKAGPDQYMCIHEDEAYRISVDGDKFGCGCGDWNHRCKGNEICKHLVAFNTRVQMPSAKLDKEVAKELIAAGWTVVDGGLCPPESDDAVQVFDEEGQEAGTVPEAPHTTSDPEGEDNDGDDPVPTAPPEREPVPMPGIGADSSTQEEPESTDAENATVVDDSDDAPEMIEQEPPAKTYVCKICGTEHLTSDAALDCIEKCKAKQDMMPGTEPFAIAPMICNLGAPQLAEVGAIRIGKKLPGGGAMRFDHFVFTTPDKDPRTGEFIHDAAMMEIFGDNCTEIPVRFVSDDVTEIFTTFYAEYGTGGIKIRGDGVNWEVTNPDGTKTQIHDPEGKHGFMKNPNIKPNGILTVLVDGQDSVGTVYRYRTTGWNSIRGMLASLALCTEIAKRAGGRIAFLPMLLKYRTKEVTPKGMRYKKIIPVITVEFRGTIEELQEQSRESGNYLGAVEGYEHLASGYDVAAETLEQQKDVTGEFYLNSGGA